MKVDLFTSSWFTPLPPDVLKIGISRGTPRGYPPGYRRMPELAPGPWFNSVSPAEYHQRFMAQLALLNAQQIVDKIAGMARSGKAALLCYESPTKAAEWCHRGQVSAWLFDELALCVPEWGQGDACGWQHPKLHVQQRRA